MSIKIRRLNDDQRYEVARDFTPNEGRISGTGEHVVLSRLQKKRITEILQGCLLALAFTDNRYDRLEQVAYMAECIATFNPSLEKLNTYDTVFCPAMDMIRTLEEKEAK